MIVKHVPGSGRKQLEVALKSLKDKVGKVGWFEKSKYPDGVQVAYVAAIQEYGYPAKNIPPRPFMRPTVQAKQVAWQNLAFGLSKQILEGKRDTEDAMELIGQKAAGDIRKTITNIFTPALSFKTIEARLSKRKIGDKSRPYTRAEIGNLYKPLVDTGLMLGTLINTVGDA